MRCEARGCERDERLNCSVCPSNCVAGARYGSFLVLELYESDPAQTAEDVAKLGGLGTATDDGLGKELSPHYVRAIYNGRLVKFPGQEGALITWDEFAALAKDKGVDSTEFARLCTPPP